MPPTSLGKKMRSGDLKKRPQATEKRRVGKQEEVQANLLDEVPGVLSRVR